MDHGIHFYHTLLLLEPINGMNGLQSRFYNLWKQPTILLHEVRQLYVLYKKYNKFSQPHHKQYFLSRQPDHLLLLFRMVLLRGKRYSLPHPQLPIRGQDDRQQNYRHDHPEGKEYETLYLPDQKKALDHLHNQHKVCNKSYNCSVPSN